MGDPGWLRFPDPGGSVWVTADSGSSSRASRSGAPAWIQRLTTLISLSDRRRAFANSAVAGHDLPGRHRACRHGLEDSLTVAVRVAKVGERERCDVARTATRLAASPQGEGDDEKGARMGSCHTMASGRVL
jgi:hypothetical protein